MKQGSIMWIVVFVVLVAALFVVLRFALKALSALLYYGVMLGAAVVLALVILGWLRRGKTK
ncbi:MAG: hypothetical protein AMXMBFR64_09270 [Myxococcales bacterium]